MRGTVAKRLRREAFRLHRYDKQPSLLRRLFSKLIPHKMRDHRSPTGWVAGQLEVGQLKWGSGFRREYLDLKKAHKEAK